MATLKEKDDRDDPSPLEKAVMLLSVLFTLALLGYMAWQAVALPDDLAPRAEVEETWTTAEGDVAVRVAVLNEGSAGLREVEVTVECGESPPALAFTNVPAHSRRAGVVTCPPGTTDPRVSVTSWIEA